MDQPGEGTVMNQKIFELGLSVDVVSVYLLCCGIADAGQKISTKTMIEIWSNTKEALEKGLDKLEEMNIIRRIISDREGRSVFTIEGVENWIV